MGCLQQPLVFWTWIIVDEPALSTWWWLTLTTLTALPAFSEAEKGGGKLWLFNSRSLGTSKLDNGEGLLRVAANFSCSLVSIPEPDLTGLDCSNLLEQVFRRLAKSPILLVELFEGVPLEWMGLPLVVFSKWTRLEDSSDAISEAELGFHKRTVGILPKMILS